MELRSYSGQGYTSIEQPFLEEMHDSPEMQSFWEKKLELIAHLRAIEGPPQWVTVARMKNCLRFTEVDTYEPVNARVEVRGCRFGIGHGFEVRYLLPASQAPWPDAWVVGQSADVAQVAEMVVKALALADTNLPRTNQEWAERRGIS